VTSIEDLEADPRVHISSTGSWMDEHGEKEREE
jgi:hypothetical protein